MNFKIVTVVSKLFIFCLLALQCNVAKKEFNTQSAESGQWVSIRSSDGSAPVQRHEAGFVGLGDRFYLLGGRGMKPVSIFDSKKKTWKNGATPPIEMHHFQPIVYENEIYIVGAMTGPYPGEIPVDHIYIYNPDKDEWRKGGVIPENRRRGGAGVAVKGDLLYLVCGIKDGHRGDHKKWMDVYNLKTEQWSILPDAPRARDHFQAVHIKGKIYAVAGRRTTASEGPFRNVIGAVDVYDITKKEWTTMASELPTPRAGNAAIGLQDELLVIGGETEEQELAHSEVEALNTKTQKWMSLPPLNRGRHGTGVVFYDGNLYMASGCGKHGGQPELSDLIKFNH